MDVQELERNLEKHLTDDGKSLVLYNDDVNTFDHVINCLVLYCDHSPTQAEQCALTVHNKGKCSVKTGNIMKLIPIKATLLIHKLNVEIE